jgi:hypothetical protein
MKCESCNINNIEIEEPSEHGLNPFRLCRCCHERLLSLTLRPLEYFNLTAIHGHVYLLHDDIYDDKGNAEQPQIEMIDAEKFPFPILDDIKTDLKKVVDFAVVQYFTSNEIIALIKNQDKQSVLNYLDQKISYNKAINYKIYEIAAKALGHFAANWIREQWNRRTEGELSIYAIALACCLPFEEAFDIATKEIEDSNEKNFAENAYTLRHFQNSKTLSWIEKNSSRIKNVTQSWGGLASVSQFNWQIADRWLNLHRPLSLIAIDALYFCTTTTGDQQLMINPQPLKNAPPAEAIAKRLQEYLTVDNVSRTRSTVDAIIKSLFTAS